MNKNPPRLGRMKSPAVKELGRLPKAEGSVHVWNQEKPRDSVSCFSGLSEHSAQLLLVVNKWTTVNRGRKWANKYADLPRSNTPGCWLRTLGRWDDNYLTRSFNRSVLRFHRLLGFLSKLTPPVLYFHVFSPFAKHIGEKSVANMEDE